MEHGAQPYRSVLYMPGSKPRALEKARSLPADAFILDLEDAVLPSEKPRARGLVADAIRSGGCRGRKLVVRINALDTEWGADDLAAIAPTGPDAILLPKVDRPTDILRAADLLASHSTPSATRLWVMIETPRAVLDAAAIAAAHPRLEGLVMGTNDLIKDLGAQQVPDRLPIQTSLALCVLSARAEGLVAIDGVYNRFQDLVGLRRQCLQARVFGFDGKTLIHPDQIVVANEVFAPSSDDITLAQAQLVAFDAAQARGEGVAVLNGRIVENLHVAMARRMLARAAAIAALETEPAPTPSALQGVSK